MTQVEEIIAPKIIKIKDLVSEPNLYIPKYQRPYKWTIKNVNQLIDDILLFQNKSAYRLGTIVLHKDKDTNNEDILNIVDGQQRTITLFLIIMTIKNYNFDNKDIKDEVTKIEIKSTLEFNNKISNYNIQQNYQEIYRRIKDFSLHTINFLLEKCEVVLVTLTDISEAFQFFDSQNARGKELDPHDLLKAFHLREMFDSNEEEKTEVVQTWENMDQSQLANLFSDRLYRIRNWSKSNSAKFFTNKEIDLFKGISINSQTKILDPYAKLYQMANIFVDNYNASSDRLIDFNPIPYPFQLDTPIINGKRFFEMVSYYSKKYNKDYLKDKEIITLLNSDEYKRRRRTGDRYIKTLFDCALIFYIDKFGEKEIDKVMEKIFVWAYAKRLEMQAVYLATIDNYALETNMFKLIREATSYREILNFHIEKVQINPANEKNDKIKVILEKYEGYYNGKQPRTNKTFKNKRTF